MLGFGLGTPEAANVGEGETSQGLGVGSFTVIRNSTRTVLDGESVLRTVGVNVPAYTGGVWDGSGFIHGGTPSLSVGITGQNSSTTNDDANTNTPNVLSGPKGAVEFIVNPSASGLNGKWPLFTQVDASNSGGIFSLTTSMNFRKTVSSVNTDLQFSYTHVGGTPARVRIAWDNVSGMYIAATDASADISLVTPSTNSNTDEMQLGDLFFIGSKVGSSHFTGDYLVSGFKFYESLDAAGW